MSLIKHFWPGIFLEFYDFLESDLDPDTGKTLLTPKLEIFPGRKSLFSDITRFPARHVDHSNVFNTERLWPNCFDINLKLIRDQLINYVLRRFQTVLTLSRHSV